jgi:bifunctional non-homologous end joining protein LigD
MLLGFLSALPVAFRTARAAFVRSGQRPKAQWVRPDVLADIEYRALTGEGKLRHPSFKGLREDLMQAPKRKRMT